MPNVSFGTYSTIAVAAASGVYRLKPTNGISRFVDILNVGAGTVFIRSDSDPSLNDPNSLQLPTNWAINSVNVDGATGLNLIAAADTTITLRSK